MKKNSNLFGLILLFFFNTHLLISQNKSIQTSGDVLLFTLPIASFGTTLIKGDKEGTWQMAKGFVLNQAVTFSLKKLINKERPNMENNDSFPSGHTSTVFQSAAFLQKRYGWKVGIPSYLLASYTGYTRIKVKKHFFTDVLAGAIIGIASSYIFTTKYEKETMELTFRSNNDILFGFNYKF